jgi:eukaryotic-like serine/threonine-protein kinase
VDPDRWRQVTGIFHAALERSPERRAAFLDDACAHDPSLRAEVDALLAGDERADRAGDPFRTPSAALPTGSLLGPYRIDSLLGAGGMGEVYKARDTRLNRTVAIKVLPAVFVHDAELRLRFEREAQAIAALHHPHICVLHDIGNQDGVEFLVMEHLEGETIDRRLKSGPMPLDRALDHAIEIADALDSAHRAGIVHRDLKPGNIMLTRDGAKLLDFGLAKFGVGAAAMAQATGLPTTPRTLTAEGTIVGTFQYITPEQLEGKEADRRSDLFAFGALLYEMVTGRRAFIGESRSNLIAAILRDQPPPLLATLPVAPPALDLVVRGCLAKDPDERLQSAHDVAMQLRWIRDGALQGAISTVSVATAPDVRRRRLLMLGTLVLVAAGAAALGAGAAYRQAQRAFTSAPPPSFKQLTFRRGSIGNAQFTADGQTIVYSAAWDDRPMQILSTRVDSTESLALPLPPGNLAAVSKSGELAILIDVNAGMGTLARVPLGGGGVRQVLDRVIAADWTRDGTELAVIRRDAEPPARQHLEFPIGKIVREGLIDASSLRVSPDDKLVAFIERGGDGAGWVSVVDRAGVFKHLSQKWPGIADGLTWTASGDEVWFNASEVGLNFALHAVTRDGRERIVEPTGLMHISDVSRDGRTLITHDLIRAGMVGLAPGETRERDLSWLDFSRPSDLSIDGRMVAFTESGAGAGTKAVAFVRGTDGSPAIRIGESGAMALSPDSQWLAHLEASRKAIELLPIGPGTARRLDPGSLEAILPVAAWTADGKSLVFAAYEPGRRRRLFVQPVDGSGPARPITPEGVTRAGQSMIVSPDGVEVLGTGPGGSTMRYRLDGTGTPTPLTGLTANDTALRWHANGKEIWLLNAATKPPVIERLEIASGRRQRWREILVSDPAGLAPDWNRVLVTPDGRGYVYGYQRQLSDLFVVQGLK